MCVHGGAFELRTDSLRALELAYERLVYGARLPAPASDDGAGGGDELDWYLATRTDTEAEALGEGAPPEAGEPVVRIEPLPSRGFDRASAYCIGHGEDLERSATLCIGEASAAARAPGVAPAQQRAYASHLDWSLRMPTAEDEQALFRAQHAPEEGVLGRRLDERSEGNGLFFEYLDRLGKMRAPAVTSTSALALSATRTRAGSLRWHAEPDIADVVRSTFAYERERVARFWDEFASARFLVARPDSWLSWPGQSGSVRRAWTIKSSSLPRNLVLPRPLSPTGSAYVVVEMDHARSLLAFRATCEGPVSWVWSALRFDAQGRELVRLHVPFQERKPTTEQRIGQLDDTRLLVLVGTNLGGVDLAHPFDPDHAPAEQHGCIVYLTDRVL